MKELLKLPVSFQKKYTCKCNCCETIKTETITYNLQVEIMEHHIYERSFRTYRLYYRPTYYSSFSHNPPVIGENTGSGKEDIEELVNDLLKKDLLKEVKNNSHG